jgi:uncharacterized protein
MAALVQLGFTLIDQKEQSLLENLLALRRVIVAYSGGTDSAYLAWAAHKALGDNAIAVTADSASIPASHKRDAEAFARECGFHHEYIQTYEFDNPDYIKNDKDRCFHCKDELFDRLESFAKTRHYDHIIYGVNKDDLGDYRPGQRAAKIHSVKAPLVEAGLTKSEIRVPYGTPVTVKTIQTIEQGEEAIRDLGFRQFRVRFHGDLVRIEIAKDELAKALQPDMATAFTNIFKPLGFLYVTLDLEGYRQGSLNAALNAALHVHA